MAITMACHVEPVVGSGAASIIATCQRVERLRGIRHGKWSRIMAVTAACQGVMDPRGIHRRERSRVVAGTAACQGAQACRSKFSWGPVSVGAWTGIICQRVSVKAARGRHLK